MAFDNMEKIVNTSETIKAFVGHSFSKEDANVVDVILKYLTSISKIYPKFSWQHAEDPEPNVVDKKVLSLINDKNLFIGICKKKELVIPHSKLCSVFLSTEYSKVKKTDLVWKTSDWIIQEIGLAIGRNMKIILLVEEGLRFAGALQGNLEHIEFNRESPEKCFEKLLGMIYALSPKSEVATTQAQEIISTVGHEAPPPDTVQQTKWKIPNGDWIIDEYEDSIMYYIFTKNKAEEANIYYEFIKSDLSKDERTKKELLAFSEYMRIATGNGGELNVIHKFFTESPDSSKIASYYAKSLLKYDEYKKAIEYFLLASSLTNDPKQKLKLLGEAALYNQKIGNESDVTQITFEMQNLTSSNIENEKIYLNTLVNIAKESKQDDIETSALEALIAMSPDDHETRFSLAYKYSMIENNELALFHYSMIPRKNRSPMTWNNLGVALSSLDMPIKSISAYRESEKQGETLAMGNIAIKLLNNGFLPEAQSTLNAAYKIKDHHENIEKHLATIKDTLEMEDKKWEETSKKSAPISEFYRELGHSITKIHKNEYLGKWKSRNCQFEFVFDGALLIATGSYQFTYGLGLLGSLMIQGNDTNSTGSTKTIIEYKGELKGKAFIGHVTRRRETNSLAATSTLLGDTETSVTALMWLSESGNKIHILEQSKNINPIFLTLEKI